MHDSFKAIILKGPIPTILDYFRISFYNAKQKAMLSRTDSVVKPQGLLVLLGEIRQCIVHFYCQAKLCLSFHYFAAFYQSKHIYEHN